jgi:hypothetical protein
MLVMVDRRETVLRPVPQPSSVMVREGGCGDAAKMGEAKSRSRSLGSRSESIAWRMLPSVS